MCARFSQMVTPRRMQEFFDLFRVNGRHDRCMIRPKNLALIVRVDEDGHRVADLSRWGLIPPWAKNEKECETRINCRSETAARLSSFRRAFKERRCLIPMDGLYEWTSDALDSQPWYISRKDGEPIAGAGLWESWQGPDGELQTFTLLMADPAAFFDEFHNREPVFLPQSRWSEWLDPDKQDPKDLQPLLVPADPDSWVRWTVHPRINGSRYDGPDANKPWTPPKRLFD